MSSTLQFRRGNTSVAGSTTGAIGELFVNTDNNTLAVHDGSTVGGWPLASASYNNGVNGTQNTSIATVTANSIYTQGVDATQNTNISSVTTTATNASGNTITLQGAMNTVNNSIIYLANIETTQNTNISYIQAGLNSANANIATLQTTSQSTVSSIGPISNTANSALANTVYLQGIETTQNTNITAAYNLANASNVLAQAAFNFANTHLNLPQTSVGLSANVYTLQSTDAGGHVYFTSSVPVNLYIPNNGITSWPIGTIIRLVSHQSSNVTVGGANVGLYLAANSTPTSRNLVSYGVAELLNTAANVWVIYGTGIV
jgi:hypothetical protein